MRYFTTCIATLFSIVEPPTPPIASAGRPSVTPLVDAITESGITITGHILLTGRFPGPIESGQPGRTSNNAIPCPNASPRAGTAAPDPNPLPMLNVRATQLPHLSETEIL